MDAGRFLPNMHTRFDKFEETVTNENDGRCPLCGGEKRPGTTTFAVDLRFGVLVVRDVPAFVCSLCGDAWIDDPVAAKLESPIAEARREQVLVEITEWPPVA
jgi:YgiT-type zinc finger domain-containing protein